MDIFSAALLLLLVIDPVGNVPVFLSALKHVQPSRHGFIILRELGIAAVVLTFFLFLGQHLLKILGVTQSSLGIAGGIILFLIALKMVFGESESLFDKGRPAGEPLIVPLAVPLLAGPSSLSAVMLLSARYPERWPEWLLALWLALAVSTLILLFSRHIHRLLGVRGLAAVERLTGMVLITVAVEMFLAGIRQAFGH